MRSFWSEPFLWIHLAGIAVVPLALQLVWLGLAVGDPLPLFWLELIFLALVGIVPVFWMQWTRPFDIFSLLIVALKPENMTLEQRRILSLFTRKKQRWLTIITAGIMLVILWQIYWLAPLAAKGASFLPQWRIVGLLLAALAFGISNLFLQIPVSVLGVLLTREQTLAKAEPYDLDKISQKFTMPGFRVNKILSISAPPETPSEIL
jgi:hypothetical protein